MRPPARLLPLLAPVLAMAVHAAEPREFPSRAGTVQVTEVATGLAHPWSLGFLPDGRMLVTEKAGRLRLVDGQGRVSPPLQGLPKVDSRGQGGLLDVALAPDFTTTREIYFSYSEPRDSGNGTAVARARLTDKGLQSLAVIFRQQPTVDSAQHFGSRLVFARDGTLFVTLGERGRTMAQAQRLDGYLGKVVRLQRDGRPAPGGPFETRSSAMPGIWSYGHRNPQGAALHPRTGELWLHEHGPQGGDEINVARAGRNYGWPVVTHGIGYDGARIGEGSQKAGMEAPLHTWVPSIAPSGMAFYTAERFPQWKDNLFVGSLKFGQLVRLELDGERVVHEERLLEGYGRRIRDVRQGPDGHLYLLVDAANGGILRLGLRPGT